VSVCGDWSVIVLSGGEGTRISPWIEQWLGTPRPKQYCSFYGSQSLLERTLLRAASLAQSDRLFTVIGCGHRRYLQIGTVYGRVVEQPSSRDTGVGVFLAASYVSACFPETTVIILPSDHFVHPEKRFTSTLRRACRLAEDHPDKLILVGAIAKYAETDYGWIAPGSPLEQHTLVSHSEAREVLAFQEKPSMVRAQAYLESGYCWNTMIVAVRLKTLWSIGERLHPECLGRFNQLVRILKSRDGQQLPAEIEREVLTRLYQGMPAFNFSRELLTPCAKQSVVLPLDGVEWSDLGRPERVVRAFHVTGLHPNVPPHLLDDVIAV